MNGFVGSMDVAINQRKTSGSSGIKIPMTIPVLPDIISATPIGWLIYGVFVGSFLRWSVCLIAAKLVAFITNCILLSTIINVGEISICCGISLVQF